MLEKSTLRSWADRAKEIDREIQSILDQNKIPDKMAWRNDEACGFLADARWNLDDCVYSFVYFGQIPVDEWKSK